MAISLQKGQKVELKKADGSTLRRVMVGLGWDAVERKGGLKAMLQPNIDCDASALLCVDGRFQNPTEDLVYYGHLTHSSGCVNHMGDNLTGKGDGDDEQIFVDLELLPNHFDRIIFVVNIYRAMDRKQDFGMVRNAFIRIVDTETNQELLRYNLSENYSGMTAMIFGELYRHNGGWKFNAIGQGTKDDNIKALGRRFM